MSSGTTPVRSRSSGFSESTLHHQRGRTPRESDGHERLDCKLVSRRTEGEEHAMRHVTYVAPTSCVAALAVSEADMGSGTVAPNSRMYSRKTCVRTRQTRERRAADDDVKRSVARAKQKRNEGAEKTSKHSTS